MQIRGAVEFASVGVPVFLAAIYESPCACVKVCVSGSGVRFLSAAQMAGLSPGVMVLVPEERVAAAPLGVI